MSTALRVAPEAAEEAQEAARWYERQGGVGGAFLDAVAATLDEVRQWPRSGALVDGATPSGRVRRIPLRRFPYHLVYAIDDDDIVHVLAVAHDRREPAYWADRLGP